ncbi:MAG TPA: hypothetical protein PK357_01095 [Candidatus Pacearchaeota archaeon]|nr:hypothetical protein [Candidatus Pacearchaeota archaeon]
MKKSVSTFVFILLVVVVAGIFTQLRSLREESLNNQILGLVVEEQYSSELKYDMNFIIDETLIEVNNEPAILEFISQSRYQSVEIIIGDKRYYLEYNSEEGKIIQTQEKETDFKIKASEKEVNKMIELYEAMEYRALGMKILKKIPWKVKITLFRECKATDWCRDEVFGR